MPAAISEFHEQVENASAVLPSVHVIPERHERILAHWLDPFEYRGQRRFAAVNVTNGDGPRAHASPFPVGVIGAKPCRVKSEPLLTVSRLVVNVARVSVLEEPRKGTTASR